MNAAFLAAGAQHDGWVSAVEAGRAGCGRSSSIERCSVRCFGAGVGSRVAATGWSSRRAGSGACRACWTTPGGRATIKARVSFDQLAKNVQVGRDRHGGGGRHLV